MVFSLKPKPIVFVGTVRKEKHGIHIYIHTHTKFNFTGKNDNEEITHEFFESTTISKSFNAKKK